MNVTVAHVVPGPAQAALTAQVIDGPDRGAVVQAEGEQLTVGTATTSELVLRDPAVSRFHLELRRASGGLVVRDLRSTNGTWLGGVRLAEAVVPAGTELRLGDSVLRVGQSADARPHGELLAGEELAGIVGKSDAMRRLMAQVQTLAGSDASVLVQGESGTGKELIARGLHDLGRRARGPLVTVDCGALAPTLVASELFGHERGAFTGADATRIGAFEQADGGTLFLDEIGELPESLQAALLGVLERRRFRRLGGTKEIEVDVRLVAATHRDLRDDINARRFRLDLYYRLAVVTLRVPPLRERRGDIARLVDHFLADCGWDRPRAALFSDETMHMIEGQHLAGNVRELRNLVEAAVAMGSASHLRLGPAVAPVATSDAPGVRHDLPYKEARAALLDGFERTYLADLMQRTNNNASAAARIACMTRSHLLDLLVRNGLRPRGE